MRGRDLSRELLPSGQEKRPDVSSMVANFLRSERIASLTDLFSICKSASVAAVNMHRKALKMGRSEVCQSLKMLWMYGETRIARAIVTVKEATALLWGAKSPKPLRLLSRVAMRKERWGSCGTWHNVRRTFL
eukprot:7311619-Ditylum_brightwellii.AAC.1